MRAGYYNNVNMHDNFQDIFNIDAKLNNKKIAELDIIINDIANFVTNKTSIITSSGVIINGSINDENIYQITSDIEIKKLSNKERERILPKRKKMYDLFFYSEYKPIISDFLLSSLYAEFLRLKSEENGIKIFPRVKYLDNDTFDFYNLFFNEIGDISINFNPIKLLINCNMLFELYEILKIVPNIDVNLEELYEGYSYNVEKLDDVYKNESIKELLNEIDNIIKPKMQRIINMASIQRINILTMRLLTITSNDMINKYFEKIGLVLHKIDDIMYKNNNYSLYSTILRYVCDDSINISIDYDFDDVDKNIIKFVEKIIGTGMGFEITSSLSSIINLGNIKWKDYVSRTPILSGTEFIHSPQNIIQEINKIKKKIKEIIITDINKLSGFLTIQTFDEMLDEYKNKLSLANIQLVKVKEIVENVLKEECIYQNDGIFCNNFRELLTEKMTAETIPERIINNFKVLLEKNIKDSKIIDNSVNLMKIIFTYFNSDKKNMIFDNIVKLRNEILEFNIETDETKKITSNINDIKNRLSKLTLKKEMLPVYEKLNKDLEDNLIQTDEEITKTINFLGIKVKSNDKNKMLKIIKGYVEKQIADYSENSVKLLEFKLDEAIEKQNMLYLKRRTLKNNSDSGISYYQYTIIFISKILQLYYRINERRTGNNHNIILFTYINQAMKNIEYDACDHVIQTYEQQVASKYGGNTITVDISSIKLPIPLIDHIMLFHSGDCMQVAILNFINYLFFDKKKGTLDAEKIVNSTIILPEVRNFYFKYNTIGSVDYNAHKDWSYILSSKIKTIMEENGSFTIEEIFINGNESDGKMYYELSVDLKEMLFIIKTILGYDGDDIINYINITFDKEIVSGEELGEELLSDDHMELSIHKGVHAEFINKSQEYVMDSIYSNFITTLSIFNINSNFDILIKSLEQDHYYNYNSQRKDILSNLYNSKFTNSFHNYARDFLNLNVLLYTKVFTSIINKEDTENVPIQSFCFAFAYKIYISSNNIQDKIYMDSILSTLGTPLVYFNIFARHVRPGLYPNLDENYINFLMEKKDIIGCTEFDIYKICLFWIFFEQINSLPGYLYEYNSLNRNYSGVVEKNEELLQNLNKNNVLMQSNILINKQTAYILSKKIYTDDIITMLSYSGNLIKFIDLSENYPTLINFIKNHLKISLITFIVPFNLGLEDIVYDDDAFLIEILHRHNHGLVSLIRRKGKEYHNMCQYLVNRIASYCSNDNRCINTQIIKIANDKDIDILKKFVNIMQILQKL